MPVRAVPTRPARTDHPDRPGRADRTWESTAARSAHPSVPADGADWLWSVAAGLASVSPPWERRYGDRPDARRSATLLWTPAYEALLLYWPPDVPIELHDHGPSTGAMCVVDGWLRETVVGPDGQRQVREFGAGEGARFDPGHVHGIVNVGVRPATSVHVYSPPLSTMTFYAYDDTGRVAPVWVEPAVNPLAVATP